MLMSWHVDVVADMPFPGAPAEIQQCLSCNERIWVALSSPKKPAKMCWRCVEAKFGDQDQTYLVTQRHLDREMKRSKPE
jgi:Ni,Fe-hydrogenase I small subunit